MVGRLVRRRHPVHDDDYNDDHATRRHDPGNAACSHDHDDHAGAWDDNHTAPRVNDDHNHNPGDAGPGKSVRRT